MGVPRSRRAGPDCKSGALPLSRFESHYPHIFSFGAWFCVVVQGFVSRGQRKERQNTFIIYVIKVYAAVTQLVECQPSKLNVASSTLVRRSGNMK